MYNYLINNIDYNKCIVIYYLNGRIMTCEEFINYSHSDNRFRNIINESIVCIPFNEFSYESLPLSKLNKNQPYFFMAIRTKFKSNIVDKTPFNDYFTTNQKEVVDFFNLNKDTILIVPNPEKGYEKYRGLKSYIVNASEESKNNFWKKIAAITKYLISRSKTIYLKTEGSGVAYVHFRIQTTTKYYHEKNMETFESSKKIFNKYFNN